MIAEALEAAWMVASALAAWIVAAGVAVTAGLYAVVAAGWGIVTALRRTVHRLLGSPEALSAPESDEPPESVPRLPQPGDRRSTTRWALPPDETPDNRKRSEAA